MARTTAKVFMHGGSQAVRLPKAFRFEVSEVDIRKEGEAVILEPVKKRPKTQADMDAFWAEMDALSAGNPFPDRPPQPPYEKRKFDW